MALSTKLGLRQSQTLVITPQLQQAIKLLQLSNLELEAFIDREIEQNPLLEREDRAATANGTDHDDPQPDDGEALDSDFGGVFPEDDSIARPPADSVWSATRGSSDWQADGGINIDSFIADDRGLHGLLRDQIQPAIADPVRRLIADHLVDMIDDAGYLRGALEEVAERLSVPLAWVEETLAVLQSFEPTGVGARDLAECLALQLKERNRFDPAMAALLAHLDLLAGNDLGRLRRLCGVDHDDLAEMIAEIKALNPKPGLEYGSTPVDPVIPDVLVRPLADGGWHVEINSDTLPKLLINQSYYATVAQTATSRDRSYLNACLSTATWLVRSLDQRIRTILKVAEEIVKQQDAFLAHGVRHLKPLSLKDVAQTISMHESTVSRVTSNKYMATPRGVFEFKYFFTSAIAAAGLGEAHSSEAVRHRIKELVDNEPPAKVLSDDKIVELLRGDGIDIARRTVAKYRELMRIPSSVQRRREKKMAAVESA